MSTPFSRARWIPALVVAFAGGVLFASSMDFTKYSWAQNKPGVTQPVVHGPGAPAGVSSFADVAERVTPTVVAINTIREARRPQGNGRMRGRVPQGMEEFLNQFGGQAPQQEMRGEGSGFIVSADGYIITNNHVVEDADQVEVTLSDQRRFKAKVVGRDSTTDVAVVKIDAKNLPILAIGDDDAARIGDWVLAVGNPLGLDFTVTAGIISAKSRGGNEVQLPTRGNLTISDFIQTDAAINPGNSGGPLINLRGEAIGLNSAIASETGYYSGYGFAIPIKLVKQVADALIKDGRVRLPVMGVQVQQASPEDAGVNGMASAAGVIVQAFNPPGAGPAKEAGIQVGDVIVAIAGQPVDRVSALQRIVRSHQIGETVAVDIMRYGSKKQFKVKLTEISTQQKVAAAPVVDEAPVANPRVMGKLGIGVEAVPAALAQRLQIPEGSGVRVTEIASNSPARDKLAPGGDVILEVLYPAPRHTVKNVADLQSTIASLKDGDYISLLVTGISTRGNPTVVNLRAN